MVPIIANEGIAALRGGMSAAATGDAARGATCRM